MKLLLLLSTFFLFAKEGCKNKKENLTAGCYKGRLEVKGACMNYTISMVAGNYDSSMVVSNWTDENTGKAYKNVFALGSRCNFPDSLNAGDEFYFKLDSSVQNCMVCMMYYPTPAKQIRIKVLPGPCTQ